MRRRVVYMPPCLPYHGVHPTYPPCTPTILPGTPCTYHCHVSYLDAAGAPTRAAVTGRGAQIGRKAWVRASGVPPSVTSCYSCYAFPRRVTPLFPHVTDERAFLLPLFKECMMRRVLPSPPPSVRVKSKRLSHGPRAASFSH